MGLNCAGPLTLELFLIVSKYYTIHSWLNRRIQNNRTRRANYKLYVDFQQHRGSAALNPMLFKDQLNITYCTSMGKMNVYLNLTPYTKINSKWIMVLNVKCKTIKLLDNHVGDLGLQDLGLCKKFLDLKPEVRSRKRKIDKLLLIKTYNFSSVKYC